MDNMRQAIMGVAFAFALVWAPVRSGEAARSPWAAAYTPTRIQWLALHLDAAFAEDCGPVLGVMKRGDGCVSLHFAASGPDTITIFVEVLGEVPADIYEKTVAGARKRLGVVARNLFGLPPPEIVEDRKVHQ